MRVYRFVRFDASVVKIKEPFQLKEIARPTDKQQNPTFKFVYSDTNMCLLCVRLVDVCVFRIFLY